MPCLDARVYFDLSRAGDETAGEAASMRFWRATSHRSREKLTKGIPLMFSKFLLAKQGTEGCSA
jgi:hypothetical protein